jgi:hypothetical protein
MKYLYENNLVGKEIHPDDTFYRELYQLNQKFWKRGANRNSRTDNHPLYYVL